tara:strand:- start:285 stop:719 length:435 start_codon:yes stop_codon:yes gene_type:complete
MTQGNENIITLKIDVEKLFSSSRKEELLLEAMKEALTNSSILSRIQEKLISKILEDKIIEDMQKSILERFTKWTPDQAEKAVNSCWYSVGDITRKAISEHEDLIKKPVLEYLITNDFSKKVGDLVEKEIKDKIVNQLNLTPYDD